MSNNYSSSLTLLCPVCACGEFEFDDGAAEKNREYLCTGCNAVLSSQAIMDGSEERLNAKVSEIGDEIMSNFEKNISKIFK